MRQPLIAGNWKMHGTKDSLSTLSAAIRAGAMNEVEIAVFPPYVYLDAIATVLSGSSVGWGAQNVAAETEGAYTGEISAKMLMDLNCRYVLVGHSERRQLYWEDDVTVARKFMLASHAGLSAVLCIGETLQQRQNNETQAVLARQLDSVLAQADAVTYLRQGVIAYEPVWAIGTGVAANPEQAQEVHQFIREHVAGYSPEIAQNLRIIYGGSVKAANAQELFAMPDIDGGLVGGASLNAVEFLDICKCYNYY